MKWLILLTFSLLALTCSAKEVTFNKRQIQIGGQTLTVEMAISPAQQQRGLMEREKLKEGEGMLFVYKREQILSFWMKNTFIPLSIGFFDKSKKLLEVQDMQPAVSLMQQDFPQYKSQSKALYALEVPRGWFKKHKIKPGVRFRFVKK